MIATTIMISIKVNPARACWNRLSILGISPSADRLLRGADLQSPGPGRIIP
jgi:hypothetical protein